MGLFVLGAIALEEMGKQQRHIFTAFAERGELQMNHVQAVIQVFAEAPFAHQRQQLNVGGGDDAHVDFELSVPPRRINSRS